MGLLTTTQTCANLFSNGRPTSFLSPSYPGGVDEDSAGKHPGNIRETSSLGGLMLIIPSETLTEPELVEVIIRSVYSLVFAVDLSKGRILLFPYAWWTLN